MGRKNKEQPFRFGGGSAEGGEAQRIKSNMPKGEAESRKTVRSKKSSKRGEKSRGERASRKQPGKPRKQKNSNFVATLREEKRSKVGKSTR